MITPIYINGNEILIRISMVTPVHVNGNEIPVRISMAAPFYINGDPILDRVNVEPVYIYTGGEDEPQYLAEAFIIRDKFGYVDVPATEKQLKQSFSISAEKAGKFGSAIFTVDEAAQILTITFSILNDVSLFPDTQFTCAYTGDPDYIFADNDFTEAVDMKFLVPYIHGETLYVELRYVF